ncbi:collagen-like triple helix repeat-containing protein [Avibacterium avium]|uniref:collagen-like triple helix repeat-containing protein n=1 Tax=Avibacterium avium TaxID=751 RepID=UPI003BF828F4
MSTINVDVQPYDDEISVELTVAEMLKGEKGEQGDPGEKGEKGDPGEKGEAGGITWTGNPVYKCTKLKDDLLVQEWRQTSSGNWLMSNMGVIDTSGECYCMGADVYVIPSWSLPTKASVYAVMTYGVYFNGFKALPINERVSQPPLIGSSGRGANINRHYLRAINKSYANRVGMYCRYGDGEVREFLVKGGNPYLSGWPNVSASANDEQLFIRFDSDPKAKKEGVVIYFDPLDGQGLQGDSGGYYTEFTDPIYGQTYRINAVEVKPW